MTDRSEYINDKLKKHTLAIRDHQISVALMFLYLNGYDVELHYVGKPNASAAQELLEELGEARIPLWSCSSTAGGVWYPWQRHALKVGVLPENYEENL